MSRGLHFLRLQSRTCYFACPSFYRYFLYFKAHGSSLYLQSQQCSTLPSALMVTSASLTFTLMSPFFIHKHPCGCIGPVQIIQDNLPIRGSLFSHVWKLPFAISYSQFPVIELGLLWGAIILLTTPIKSII